MAKRIIALALVLCLTLCFFASCGSTLSGTYKSAEVFGSYTSLKFSGSKVTSRHTLQARRFPAARLSTQ